MKDKTPYPPKRVYLVIPPYIPSYLHGSFAFPEDIRSTVMNWLH